MFQHILVPLDGSRTAALALEKAGGLAKAFGAKVTVATVVDSYPFAHGGGEFSPGQGSFMDAARASADALLQRGVAELAAAGVAAGSRRVDGHAVHDGILQAATECGADLIVMGSHGRHGVEKLLLGSTAQRVLSHTRLPVFVVRG